ncbi:MAG: hypothetical protein AAGC47_13475 [Bacteroidota bacterium]
MKTTAIPVLTFFVLACISCSNPNHATVREKQNQTNAAKKENLKKYGVITPQQETAFDAMNQLQVSTNEQNRLYSTFAGSAPLCFDKDTTVTISQSEFRKALIRFTLSNCDILMASESEELATKASLAQEEYSLTICLEGDDKTFQDDLLFTKGTWILPDILGSRDLVMVW